MVVIRILSHPYTLMFAFLMLLISGEHFMGFYIFYMLLGLPHGVLHAWLAVGGLLIIVVTYLKFQGRKAWLPSVLNLVGVILLLTSIWVFFDADESNYNRATFREVAPMISFIIAGIIIGCFIVAKVLFIFPEVNRRKVGGAHRAS